MKPTPPPTNAAAATPTANGWLGYNGATCDSYKEGEQYHTYCGDAGTGADTRTACVACRQQCRGSPACTQAEMEPVAPVAEVAVTVTIGDDSCENLGDFASNCDDWATAGECEKSKAFMTDYCCGSCKKQESQRRSTSYNGVPAGCNPSAQIVNGISIVTCQNGQQYAADANDYYWPMGAASSSLRRAATAPAQAQQPAQQPAQVTFQRGVTTASQPAYGRAGFRMQFQNAQPGSFSGPQGLFSGARPFGR